MKSVTLNIQFLQIHNFNNLFSWPGFMTISSDHYLGLLPGSHWPLKQELFSITPATLTRAQQLEVIGELPHCQFCAARTWGWGLHLWDRCTHTPQNLRLEVWVALIHVSGLYFRSQVSWPQVSTVYQQELPLRSSQRWPWTICMNI